VRVVRTIAVTESGLWPGSPDCWLHFILIGSRFSAFVNASGVAWTSTQIATAAITTRAADAPEPFCTLLELIAQWGDHAWQPASQMPPALWTPLVEFVHHRLTADAFVAALQGDP
jgi:hypothetical protein